MTYEILLAEARLRYPAAFSIAVPDPPASESQVQALEKELMISLEESYRQFLIAYGGGEIEFEVLFSADPQSDWYLPRQLARAINLPKDFLPVTENFCGDYYGFIVTEGKCRPPILRWDHESQEIKSITQKDIFEYMAQFALQPA